MEDNSTFSLLDSLSQMLLAKVSSVILRATMAYVPFAPPMSAISCFGGHGVREHAIVKKEEIMYSSAAENARWQRTGFRKYVPTSSYCIGNIAILYTSL